jgi:DNA-binding XRE family transcriptional regulator
MRKRTREEMNTLRMQFYEDIRTNKLTLPETVRHMRRVIGMSQPEYAHLVGITPRIVIDLERGVGNPTLKTLQKLGKPFGLEVRLSRWQDDEFESVTT